MSPVVPDKCPPRRECGTCTLCCKLFLIPEIAKPAGQWCAHCAPGRGCGIYVDRPRQCRDFSCLWMNDANLSAEWKPERSKIVLSLFPSNGFLYAQVDPGAPGAWRKAPYHANLRAWAKSLLTERRHVIVFVNDMATLIMPDDDIPLGPMKASDQFRIEPTFGPNGQTYRVARL